MASFFSSKRIAKISLVLNAALALMICWLIVAEQNGGKLEARNTEFCIQLHNVVAEHNSYKLQMRIKWRRWLPSQSSFVFRHDFVPVMCYYFNSDNQMICTSTSIATLGSKFCKGQTYATCSDVNIDAISGSRFVIVNILNISICVDTDGELIEKTAGK